MVAIQPRFLLLLGLCVVASSSASTLPNAHVHVNDRRMTPRAKANLSVSRDMPDASDAPNPHLPAALPHPARDMPETADAEVHPFPAMRRVVKRGLPSLPVAAPSPVPSFIPGKRDASFLSVAVSRRQVPSPISVPVSVPSAPAAPQARSNRNQPLEHPPIAQPYARAVGDSIASTLDQISGSMGGSTSNGRSSTTDTSINPFGHELFHGNQQKGSDGSSTSDSVIGTREQIMHSNDQKGSDGETQDNDVLNNTLHTYKKASRSYNNIASIEESGEERREETEDETVSPPITPAADSETVHRHAESKLQ